MNPAIKTNDEKTEVIRIITDPEIELERIIEAFNNLDEEDRDRMPYIERIISIES